MRVLSLRRVWSWVSCGLLAVSCAPAPDLDDTRIVAPRVLAVRAEPPEAAPGAEVALAALVAGPDGTVSAPALVWRICVDRKSPLEPGAVAAACLSADEAALPADPRGTFQATGPAATLTVPQDACRLFGPDPPPVLRAEVPDAGVDGPAEPPAPATPGLPALPDATGGYQQPIMLTLDAREPPAVYGLRLTCGAPGATRAEAARLRRFGHPNGSPRIESLSAAVDGAGPRPLPTEETPPLRVHPGATLALRVGVPACPAPGQDVCGDGFCGPREDAAGCGADCAAPHPCGGAERYVFLDPTAEGADRLRERVEGLSAAFYATDGDFDTPRASTDGLTAPPAGPLPPTDTLATVFHAPDTPGPVTLWVVLRDERGAADARAARVEVR